jgi:hypothetical protein
MSETSNATGVIQDPSPARNADTGPAPSGKKTHRRVVNPVLILLTGAIILFQVIGLSPKNLELGTESDNEPLLDPQDLTLAQSALHPLVRERIPVHKVPEYTIEQFQYTALLDQTKVWRIMADRSSTYQKENITHASSVTLYIFPDLKSSGTKTGKASVITAQEALYGNHAGSEEQNIELFGNVEVTTAEGYILRSPYFIYRPNLKRIQAPTEYLVVGLGKEARQKGDLGELNFTTQGIDIQIERGIISLLLNPVVTLQRTADGRNAPKIPEQTEIESHHAKIDTRKRVTDFEIQKGSTDPNEFVRITQPQLYARSRRATLKLLAPTTALDYLHLEEDVLIKQRKSATASVTAPLRYATGGKADFNAQSNLIVLKEYPQIYEDQNTMTGETIQISSDFDSVEIEHSNAFATEDFGKRSP